MRITESHLRNLIKEHVKLLIEGDVIDVDFSKKNLRNVIEPKILTPSITDVFLFTGSAGQLARVVEMSRDDSTNDGGTVFYEQYIKNDGVWTQSPQEILKKSFIGFVSKYTPFDEVITHLTKRKNERDREEKFIEAAMSEKGFKNYKNVSKEVMRSDEYKNAWIRAVGDSMKFTTSKL